jgi:hypothetical protein
MRFFWGDDILEESAGLDILGVRGLDQAIEASLVNGITTISNRARYLTLLPWALGMFFEMDLEHGEAEFDRGHLGSFLQRLEFLILAATLCDPDADDTGGAIGMDLYGEAIGEIRAGRSAPFPTGGSEAMLNTYYGPSRAIGFTADGISGSGAPYRLTPRGQNVWEMRKKELGDSPVLHVLTDGWELDRTTVDLAVPSFSLAALARFGTEGALLREAFFQPWTSSTPAATDRVARAYQQFVGSVEWISAALAKEPARASALLTRNYTTCCLGEVCDPTSVRWAEYEWRRRCHYALELMLSAVCGTLNMIGDSTLPDLVAYWREGPDATSVVAGLWSVPSGHWDLSAREVRESVPDGLFLGQNVPVGLLNRLSAAEQALMSFCLLSALAAQTRDLRMQALFPVRKGPGDHAVEMILAAGETPFHVFLEALAAESAVSPHLATTLRKMGNNQKCSLRFFPDGPILRATGIVTSAGHSNDRLSNTMRMLADVRLLSATSSGYTVDKALAA